MQFQVRELVKISRTRIKIKDINRKFFYKLFLNIKSWNICCCFHIKIFKEPLSQFLMLEASKNRVIWLDDSVKILDFHHSIFMRQDRSAVGLCYLQWSNLVKFYPLNPPTNSGCCHRSDAWSQSREYISIGINITDNIIRKVNNA